MNLIESFKNYLVMNERSSNTVKSYGDDLIQFKNFLNNERCFEFHQITVDNVDKIKYSDMTAWISSLQKQDISASSRARKVSTLKSFYLYIFNKLEIIKTNPTLKLDTPKIGKRLPKFLSLEQAQEMINLITNERDKAIIVLFLNTGLRVSELENLTLDDISDDRVLRVVGKGNKERQLHLNDYAYQAIQEYLKARYSKHSSLFINRDGKPLGYKRIQDIVKECASRIGVDISAHKLRHTAATLMHQNGVDIRTLQEILGHESPNTTAIYTHVTNKNIITAMDLSPLNKKEK